MLNPAIENRIEVIAHAHQEAGLDGGSPIVYRDPVRAGLGLAVVANGHFAGKVDMRISTDYSWCVIGTSNPSDNAAIRSKVTAMHASLQVR